MVCLLPFVDESKSNADLLLPLAPLMEKFDEVCRIYQLIQTKKPRNVVFVKKVAQVHERVEISLAPIGTQVDPEKLEPNELIDAIRCILLGLIDLHSFGIVHHDIRWENILKNEDETELGTFFLSILMTRVLGLRKHPGLILTERPMPQK
jgi:serine/threonine protein kinase